MLLKENHRQIQSFLMKYDPYSNFHKFCSKNDCSDACFQSSVKMQRSPHKITLKKYKSTITLEKNQSKFDRTASKPSLNQTSPPICQSSHLDSYTTPHKITPKQVNTIKKIRFSYSSLPIQNNPSLQNLSCLSPKPSEFMSTRLQFSSISKRSLGNSSIPVKQIKSTPKIDYVGSMENQELYQAANHFSRSLSPSIDINLEIEKNLGGSMKK